VKQTSWRKNWTSWRRD